MRLLTFRVDGAGRTGLLRPDGSNEVVELEDVDHMLDLIDAGPEGLAHAARTLASARSRSHRLQDVEVLAPLPNPRGNVIAIGRNYQAHAEESARAAGKSVDPPTVFTKAVTTIAGPYDDVVADAAGTSHGDWDGELGWGDGRPGSHNRPPPDLHHR